jgi:transposase
MSKYCKKCNSEKPVSEFYVSRPECKECTKAKSKLNRKSKEERTEYNKQYWAKNKARLTQANKEYYEANKEKLRQQMKDYYRNNKSAFLAYNSNRRAALLNATPKWADLNEIKYIYELAQKRDLVVDHMIPLNNKFVCGLHTPDNLRCISHEWNAAKSNKFYGDWF